jgi:hypothetical protein
MSKKINVLTEAQRDEMTKAGIKCTDKTTEADCLRVLRRTKNGTDEERAERKSHIIRRKK